MEPCGAAGLRCAGSVVVTLGAATASIPFRIDLTTPHESRLDECILRTLRQHPGLVLQPDPQLRDLDHPAHVAGDDHRHAADAQGHSVDDDHAAAPAGDAQDPAEVQGRSPEAERRAPEVLQGERHQPLGGVSAAPCAGAGVHRAVPGAARPHLAPARPRFQHRLGVGPAQPGVSTPYRRSPTSYVRSIRPTSTTRRTSTTTWPTRRR